MGFICTLLSLWLFAVFIRIVLSWFPASPGGVLASVSQGLGAVTDPVLRPVRNMLPPVNLGGVGLDLSPMVVLLLGSVLLRVLC